MNSVMISIQPKWCDLILRRRKTIEVRKTKPKFETPFKCYIYCTLNGADEFSKKGVSKYSCKKGYVIGEFICDKIITIDCDSVAPFDKETKKYISKETCLTRTDLYDYTHGFCCFGWKISDLHIYNEPKELSQFYKQCNEICEQCDYFIDCKYGVGKKHMIPLKKAPQSWQYIESGELK